LEFNKRITINNDLTEDNIAQNADIDGSKLVAGSINNFKTKIIPQISTCTSDVTGGSGLVKLPGTTITIILNVKTFVLFFAVFTINNPAAAAVTINGAIVNETNSDPANGIYDVVRMTHSSYLARNANPAHTSMAFNITKEVKRGAYQFALYATAPGAGATIYATHTRLVIIPLTAVGC